MADPTQPQDRKISAAEQRKNDDKQKRAVAEFMAAGIDFSPFTVDAGDGVEWEFRPDPMPADLERLRKAGVAVKTASEAGEGLVEAYDEMADAIRSMLISEKQRAEFPKPQYGTLALSFFSLHLQQGRTGFPTES